MHWFGHMKDCSSPMEFHEALDLHVIDAFKEMVKELEKADIVQKGQCIKEWQDLPKDCLNLGITDIRPAREKEIKRQGRY